MKYHPKSQRTLTAQEESWLVTHLRQHWQDALQWPVLVEDGYAFHGTSVTGAKGETLVIGIDRLYEESSDEMLRKGGSGSEFKGLYYPGATPKRTLLFESTIYFDETYLLHPGSTLNDHTRHPYDEPDPTAAGKYRERLTSFLKRLSDFDADVLPLKRAGVLRACPPRMQDHPAFIELVTSDLGDKEFCSIAAESSPEPVFVAARKMEPLLPLVGDGLRFPKLREDLLARSRYAHFDEAERPELFRPRLYGVKEVAPVLGASILLNHALLLAEEYRCLPVTDEPRMARLLQCKLERIQKARAFADYRRELQLKSTSLAIRVLEEYLPRFQFESFDQTLEARERLKEPLARFRDAMRAFAAEIDESPYAPDLLRKIEEVVASKVKPAVRMLETEIQTSRDDFVSKCLRNLRAGSVPLIASIFAGLPTSAVISIGAGVMTFEAAIETYREVKRTKNNGLCLLLSR